MRASQQWMDAGITKRALSELEDIEMYMTTTSELGARFHLMLAKTAEANGQNARARRTWRRPRRSWTSRIGRARGGQLRPGGRACTGFQAEE